MSAAVLKKMRDMGLTIDQAIELLETLEQEAPAKAGRSSAAERQARYRARQAVTVTESVTRDVTRDVTEPPSLPPPPQTPPPPNHPRVEEPPIVPQGDEEPSTELVDGEPSKTDEVRQAFDDWNLTADRCGLAKALDLTEARRRSLGKRLKAGGLERWRSALAAVEASAFCLGQAPSRNGGKPFKASLDFVCQQSSFQKLIEGFYGQDAKPVFARVQALPIDPNDKWRTRVRNHIAKLQYWNADDLGPPPGKPGCTVPAEVLREFGIEPAPLLRAVG